MNVTIHSSMLPQDDPDAALAFYRDTLGFEVRNDVEYGGMHWITVGPSEQPENRPNGVARATTYVNPTTLTASIPAGDIASTAAVATITVFTPDPGGGTSGPSTLTLRQPVLSVSANTTLVDASAVPDPALGEEVVLLGRQDEEEITPLELAQATGSVYRILATIPLPAPASATTATI